MTLLFFFIGVMVGGILCVVAMCLFAVSGAESRKEQMIQND